MTDPLPPFSITSICAKCGYAGGAMPWPVPEGHGARVPGTAIFPVFYHDGHCSRADCPGPLGVEHLLRICPRCGFTWAEACVNTEGGAA